MNVSTLLLLFSSFIAFRSTIAEHVVLLDTRTATSELNWKTWSNQEGRDGWLEETTYSEEQKVNHRIFSICEFGHIDNWLLVPAVDSNGEASRLQLEIGYNIAKCEKFLVLSKQKLTSCRETMKLYGMTLHGGEQLGNNWSNDTKWQYLETLVVKSESDTKHVLTVSYRVGQPLPTSRVHFALKNTGACAAVLYMKVYYNYCPETSQSFMKLPRTLPSADTNSVVTVMGSCVRNASPSFDIDSAVNNLSSRSKIAAPPPTFICKADGTWQSVGTSHCECNSGYVPSAKTNSCANAHSPQSSLSLCSVNAFGGSHSSKLDVNKPSQSDNDWLSGIYSSQRVWLWLFIGLALPIMLCCVLCTIHRHNHKQQVADMVHLDNYKQDILANLPLISAYTPRSNLNGGVKLINNNRCFKPYVDPTTYEDPNMALNQFTNEIDMNCVNVTRVIGAGEFGEVCSGRLITVDAYGQHHEHVVAVKTLLSGSSPKAKSDFLMEALIMGQFEHENVIRLLGVVTKSEPVMILTEYMINGSLDSFLKRDDNKIEVSQLVEMLEGIAHGMKYLTDKGYVHRDLAARNVLVDDRLICKIADFGLSRGLSDSLGEQEYTTNNSEKIPIRWTAPEAIAHSKYTAASDVWSYGVMMWEVFSFGDRPYGSWTNHKVIDEVRSGYRLTPPMSTPNKLRELMCRCWAMERHERPTFGQILEELNNYRTEEFYFRQRPSPTRFVVNPYNNGR